MNNQDLVKQNLLYDFNNTKGYFPSTKTVYELFEHQVQINPENTALIIGNAKMTYRELNHKANQLASVLISSGIKEEEIVGLITDISFEMIIGIIGILKAGGAYLPLDPEYPSDRIGYLLRDSEANLLVTHSSYKGSTAFEGKEIFLDAEIEYTGDTANISGRAKPESLAYVMYTSGSTGIPKGVMIQHNSVVNQLYFLSTLMNLDLSYNHILMAPYTFDASVKHIFLSLTTGGKLHLVPKAMKTNPLVLTSYMHKHNINIMNVVPSLMSVLVENIEPETKLHFKCIMLAGEVFSQKLYQRIKSTIAVDRVFNIYGPTEATINATYYECKENEAADTLSIGKPMLNYRIYILDDEQRPLPVGVPGELCIAGVGVARGYLKRPEENSKKFMEDPFVPGESMYRSGDLAKVSEDGNIEFLGRIDHQVKIRGQRIELGEIEVQLKKHEKISEAVILAKEDENSDKHLWAYVAANSKLTAQEIRAYLLESLPEHMVPAYYVLLQNMPLNQNNKIDRAALEKINTYESLNSEFTLPANHIEERVQIIWQKVLGLDRVGVSDNFYEIGGSSIDTIKLSMEIQKEFKVKMSLFDLFNSPTIRDISELIFRSKTGGMNEIKRGEEQEYYELTHMQKRMWIMNQLKTEGFNYNTTAICEIEGSIDIQTLQNSLDRVVSRHEALRTNFITVSGEAKQKIHKELNIKLNYMDFRDYENKEYLAEQEAKKAFDYTFRLSEDPLLKVILIQTEDDKYLIAIVMHHTISDGWSMKIFIRELLEVYTSYMEGREPRVKTLDVQYKDYAAWLNEQIGSEAGRNCEKYWVDRFADGVPLLNLKTDYPRPDIKTHEAKKLYFNIENSVTSSIKQICKRNNTTYFMTMLSTIYALLYNYTKQKDIVIGTVVAGREDKSLENMIGFFVNTMPLKITLNEEDTFKDLLEKVKTTTIEAFENQIYSYDSLVERLGITRDISRSPLFDVSFLLDNSGYDNILDSFKDIKVKQYEFLDKGQEYTNMDMAFEFRVSEKDIEAIITYNQNLYESQRIQLMKNRYIELLEKISNNPDIKIRELSFESEQLLKTMEVEFDF